MSEHGGRLAIEVVCGDRRRQVLLTIEVPAGTGARDAVRLSGMAAQFPGFDLEVAPLGIFGEAVPDATVLAPGDRVEIYRQLIAAPMEARRRRARESADPQPSSSDE